MGIQIHVHTVPSCMLAGGGEYFGLETLPKFCWISYLVRRVSGEARQLNLLPVQTTTILGVENCNSVNIAVK